MALDANIRGSTSGLGAEVNASNQLKVVLETDVGANPQNVGAVRFYSENDTGVATGSPNYLSPETDTDYRLRVSNDIILDEEDLTYSAQNFTKHAMHATTFVPTWTPVGFNTNPTNTLTSLASTVLRTYKTFSIEGTETLALDLEASLNIASGAAIPAQQVVEFGFGLVATGATPIDFFDGVYFRVNSSGVYGVIRNNSVTDSAIAGPFNDYTGAAWTPISGRKYQWLVYITTRVVQFWVSDPVTEEIWLAGQIDTPPGYGQPTASQALQFVTRHYISGAATVGLNFQVSRYNVRRGGTNIGTTLNVLAARAMESNLSPGTLATTANQTVTTGTIVKTTAAVPTNTAALLVNSLSGIVQETATLATTVDGMLMSYQNPALPTGVSATYAQGKRLRIDAINIASSVALAFTGGPISKHFYLAYGSTLVSLQGVAADTVTTKAYRRVQLPIVQYYASGILAGAQVPTNSSSYVLQTPIYVNPGEFIALVTFHVGTAPTVGTINHAISFDYSWE